jgi:dihydroorotase
MNRRAFLGSFAGAALAQRPAADHYDILIRGGEVRDPSRGFAARADVAIAGGKIAAIEPEIPADRGIDTINARGMYVTPGLVDLHTHCYHSATGSGVEADPIAARSGTTTWVDAGTFGVTELAGFRRFIVEPAQARIYGFVYLYPNMRNPDVDPVKYVRGYMKRTGEAVVANRDILLGVKFQVGSNMNGRYSLDFLKVARELCDQYKIPLMAHISFAPPETDQVMELMRPGDVVTHCYNTHTLGILDASGKVRASVREARRRGVLFDVGHGLGSFNFTVARKALDDGFPPDTISTDIYNLNVNGPVYDLPTTLTKFLYLGMSLEDVLLRATVAPARIVNRLEGMGTLAVGAPADVAIFQMEEGQFQLTDSQRNTVTTSRRLVNRLTICRGRRLRAAAV